MIFDRYLKCRHPERVAWGGPSFRGLIAKGWVAVGLCGALALLPASAQSTPQSGPQAAPTPQPGSTVIFSRDAATSPSDSPSQSLKTSSLGPGDTDPLHLTQAERTALTFTAYDLDLHLTPASAGLSARAALTVRNDSQSPLTRLVLQLTSTLRWDSISLRADSNSTPVPAHFTSRLVDTDADHTGAMSEAVITLPQPLAPGASLSLIALYSGAIPQSANRLTRIGAPAPQAIAQDWDVIAPADASSDIQTGTALRGFGNVLWYPVSAPPVFLGDGAKLFSLVGHTKLRESAATLRLRLAIEYDGEPPDAAYLNGRRAQLTAISDNADAPAAAAPGIATATFDAQPIGFRTPSLFVTAAAAHLTGTPENAALIAAITGHDTALSAYSSAAQAIEPLLANWLGPRPSTPLTILDHPGEPFEDDALLVQSMSTQSMQPPVSSSDPKATTPSPESLEPALVHSLTHAWIDSTHPWMNEGLPEFMSLLWTERTQNHAAALAQLAQLDQPLALVEPDFSDPNHAASPAGASLADASGEVFYRNKAAAVWWMLRAIAGEDALKQALQDYRRLSAKGPHFDDDPQAFERTLEAAAHMDLAWFFRDWVYADRGLPDLRIASVTPSRLQPNGAAAAGWLVAVEVHNDGYAEAQVPVIVRSADATETRQLRVPGRASTSVRVVFAGRPDQVQVNDGTVPETQTSIHTRELVLPA
ncbi:MAG TPA: hypothetical protein VII58_08840, partial [Acidobacteriaceae bacterium]